MLKACSIFFIFLSCVCGISACFSFIIIINTTIKHKCNDPKYPLLLKSGDDYKCFGTIDGTMRYIDPVNEDNSTNFLEIFYISLSLSVLFGIIFCCLDNKSSHSETLQNPEPPVLVSNTVSLPSGNIIVSLPSENVSLPSENIPVSPISLPFSRSNSLSRSNSPFSGPDSPSGNVDIEMV